MVSVRPSIMARTRGAKSAEYGAKRAALLHAFRNRLVARDRPPPSLRELAAAAGVTIPTVRHYFGKRADLVAALLADLHRAGAGYLDLARQADLPFAASMALLARFVAAGLEAGLSEIHALGLREGLRHSRLGPAYLDDVLEPTLQAIEVRLQRHQDRKEMRPVDVRVAAVGFLAPLIVGHIHQHELGGRDRRPLDLNAFVDAHVDAFLRAYESPAYSGDAIPRTQRG
jgi:AcrR family transcriptional regulator